MKNYVCLNTRKSVFLGLLFIAFILPKVSFGQGALAFSQSYQNVSRPTGGNFVAGDIIEIRTSITVPTGTSLFSVRVSIPIPANTTYQLGTLKITSNENTTTNAAGTVILGAGNPFTDAKADDRADTSRTGAVVTSGNFRIGLDATNGTAQATTAEQTTTGGRITGGNTVPTFYGSATIVVAALRVTINAADPIGTVIGLGTTVTYKATAGGADVQYIISPSSNTAQYTTLQTGINNPLCTTGRGDNLFRNYTNGTFGSGVTQNGPAIAGLVNFTQVNIGANNPNDGQVAVVNNTSSDGTTGKVFNLWDIYGDHTGAANSTTGNAATTLGATGGYLLAVNASYPTTQIASQTVTGLCPNTTYNFEFWIRNICSGCSSNQVTAAASTPAAPGVSPNVTFELNGNGYYTTGDIPYAANTWLQKGFTFTTGAAQTSASFGIRNNANGGGGNDWTIDDIAISVCGPNITSAIAPGGTLCTGSTATLSGKVFDPLNQYSFYQWQVSSDGGTTWTNLTGTGNSGNASNVTVFYSLTGLANGTYKYRIAAATSAANLASNDGGTPPKLTCAIASVPNALTVSSSGCILPIYIGDFTANILQKDVQLDWTTFDEANTHFFSVERSYDGTNFNQIAKVNAGGITTGKTAYRFTDLGLSNGVAFYRITLHNNDGITITSKVLSVRIGDGIKKINIYPNPAKENVYVDFAGMEGKFQVSLVNSIGQPMKQFTFNANSQQRVFGIEKGSLSTGVYFVKINNVNTGESVTYPIKFQ